MSSINKQTCPTCGQSVNKREISVYKGLVVALYKVWQYCENTKTSDLTMHEIRQLLGQIDYSRFNDWKRFEPGLVWGSRGKYSFDVLGLRDIFKGNRKLCTTILRDPLTKTIERTEFKRLRDVPSLTAFLDEQDNYIAAYQGQADNLEQMSII